MGKTKESLLKEIEQLKKEIEKLRRKEAVLIENAERFRSIGDNSHAGIIIVDQNYTITYANKEFCKMVECKKKEVVGADFRKFLDADSKALVEDRYIRRQREEKIPPRYQFNMVTKTGKVKTVEISVSVVRHKDSKIETIAQLLDITERQQTKESLEHSERKYLTLIEALQEGLTLVDLDDNILFANSALAKMTGYAKDEILQMNIRDLIVKDEIKKVKEETNKRKFGIASHYETKIIRKDGKVKSIKVSAVPWRDKKNKVAGVLGLILDITEQKQAEESLKKEKEYYKSFVESLSDWVWEINVNGEYTYSNPAVEKILGYKIEEIKGAKFGDVFLFCNDGKKVTKENLFNRKGWKNVEMCFKRKDGREVFTESTAIPIFDHNNNVIGYRGIDRDLTERKKYEQQALQKERLTALGQLGGGVAHEFNNLLMVIEGYTEMAMMDVNKEDPLYNTLKQIYNTTMRAINLTRQLLLFSRTQSVDLRSLNLNSIINKLVKVLERIIGEDITMRAELDPKLWNIEANAAHMEQLIINMIVNARDAMPKGGKITLKTENVVLTGDGINHNSGTDKYVSLWIQDTGIGMDEVTKQHIFEPFYSTKGEGKGTGLGLSVVYGIVKQHKGKIEVESKKNQGTTFKFYFPVSQSKKEKVEEKDLFVKKVEGKGEGILVVEDDEAIRLFTEQVLRENGYKVFSAEDARKASRIFTRNKEKIDIVFADVVLPDINGVELVQKLLNKKPKLSVILCSGYTDSKVDANYIKSKGYKFLQKPYSIADIFKAIKEVLAK